MNTHSGQTRREGKRIDFPAEGDKQGDKMENKNVRMPNVLRAKVSSNTVQGVPSVSTLVWVDFGLGVSPCFQDVPPICLISIWQCRIRPTVEQPK